MCIDFSFELFLAFCLIIFIIITWLVLKKLQLLSKHKVVAEFQCTHCNCRVTVGFHSLDHDVTCPKCGHVVKVT
jgi:Zn finger protein HypA/HybF involved in hydrogenase expression